MNSNIKDQLDKLKRNIEQVESAVSVLKKTIESMEKETDKVDYSQMEGEFGVFDGYKITTDGGQTFEVNQNYAAKSKLVHGDTLKLIEENGKKVFKQIDRVERMKLHGILTKKDGEWYVLTDRGSYKVSDTAAEFHKSELNSECTVLVPQDNPDAPFATLDKVEGYGAVKIVKDEDKPASKPQRDSKPKPKGKPKSSNKPKPESKPKSNKPLQPERKKEDANTQKSADTSTGSKDALLDDDDLV